MKLERFCVTPAQSRGVNLATQCPHAWLSSTAAASSLMIWFCPEKAFTTAVEEPSLMLLALQSVLFSFELV